MANLAMETLKKTYKSGTGWEMILQHKKYALIPIFHAASLLKKGVDNPLLLT